jgi:hypothetical protein
MSKPHKYAEAIKAWAEGREVQCRYIDGRWPWETYVGEAIPSFDHPELEWRVKPRTSVRWLNVYGSHFGYETKDDADVNAQDDRIACVRVEFTEGEGLE